MARHRRRRRYGDPVISMPSFGSLKDLNPLGKTVRSTDVLIGAGIGLAGGGLVMYGVRQFWPNPPAFVTQYSGPLSALAAGVGAYALFQKKSKARALGYFAGAATIALVPLVYSTVKSALPSSVTQYFGDPVISMPSFGRFGSMLTNSPGPYAGLLTPTPGPGPARRAMGY
jgi:hypothetical protein